MVTLPEHQKFAATTFMIYQYATILSALLLLITGDNSTAQTTLLGTTSSGGYLSIGVGSGTFFSIAPGDTVLNQVFKLEGAMGAAPQRTHCIEAGNGKLYGVTGGGGNFGLGVLFEYDYNTNSYAKKIDFDSANGANPYGSLMLAGNGRIYGMTARGGANNLGVIFEYDYNTNTYIKRIDFDVRNGMTPTGSLIQAGNGKLYGMANAGGTNGCFCGAIFEYDYSTNIYSKKIDLTNAGGINPGGSLMQANNGKLYGMTYAGGTNGCNCGVIFEYDYSTNIYTKKFEFSPSNGVNPEGSLVQAGNNKLYGMVPYGGASNYGLIFEYDFTTNTYTKKIDLSSVNGGRPKGSLLQATNGKLYGMTGEGGVNGKGVIFEYDYNTNSYSKKIDLAPADGYNPLGSLMQASNGKLYGLTQVGGVGRSNGVLFEYDYSTNSYTRKVGFPMSNGDNPYGSLMLASNGKFYGMTKNGGPNDLGVIYEYDYSTNSYIKKIDFTSSTGSNPLGTLVQATNGKLYGLTSFGGAYNVGVIFEYDLNSNTYTKKVDFNNANGSNPNGSLIQAGNGKLYGVTDGGGSVGSGVLFEFDYVNNLFTKKIDFIGTNGTRPCGTLLKAVNGKLYGMTLIGGSNNAGVIFEYDYNTNACNKMIDLTQIEGSFPQGSLIQASNGKLYGMTWGGGINSYGVIFEYDYNTNSYTKKIDLTPVDGRNPMGSLIQSANGKLYGTTSGGGRNNAGVVFEYDYTTNAYTKRLDLDAQVTGSNPQNASLLEINSCKNITASGPTSFCPGGSVDLDAGAGSSFLWSNGVTTRINHITASGTYTVAVNGIQSCAPVVVTVNPQAAATITAGGPTTICYGNSVTLTASTGSSYLWSNGATTQTITTGNAGNYTVSVSNAFGCAATSAATAVTISGGNNAPTLQWDKAFGGNNGDYLRYLQQTTDGGYILGGYSLSGISGDKTGSQDHYDYWIVKTDANGNKLWDKTFGGSDEDFLYSLQQTADGGYILGGHSLSGISGDKTQPTQGVYNYDYWVVKIDANGTKQWDRDFGGTRDDNLYSLQQTTDGGYIIGGSSYSNLSGDKKQATQGGFDYWVVKIDANGNKLWDKTFGGSSDDYLHFLQQTGDGGYILGGYSLSGISGDKTQPSQGDYDYWVVKIDANGTKQWDRDFGRSGADYLYSLQQTTDGGYILGGYSNLNLSGGNYDYWIVKTDVTGSTQWDKRFGGSSFEALYSIQQTTDGGYLLAGSSKSGISGDKTQPSQGDADYWIVRTDANGSKQWDKSFGGSADDELSFLEQTANGSYILGGYSQSGISGNKTQASQGLYDFWIVKLGITYPAAAITAGGPTTFCGGGSVTLTASAGSSYLWNTGATTQSIVVTTSGNYSVTADGCSNSTPVIVTVNPSTVIPTITAGGPTTFCQGGSVTLTATGATSYLWSNNATTQSIAVTASGNYSVRTTDASGCAASSPATIVTVNALPVASIVASSPACITGCVTLTASGGGSYRWSTASTSSSIIACTAGTFTVTVTANGCSASTQKTLGSPVLCPVPINLTVTNVTAKKAKLNWATNTCATGYTVQYRKVGTATWKSKTVTGNTGFLNISALTTRTAYEWSVRTKCSGTVFSAFSVLGNFTTP